MFISGRAPVDVLNLLMHVALHPATPRGIKLGKIANFQSPRAARLHWIVAVALWATQCAYEFMTPRCASQSEAATAFPSRLSTSPPPARQHSPNRRPSLPACKRD